MLYAVGKTCALLLLLVKVAVKTLMTVLVCVDVTCKVVVSPAKATAGRRAARKRVARIAVVCEFLRCRGYEWPDATATGQIRWSRDISYGINARIVAEEMFSSDIRRFICRAYATNSSLRFQEVG
jgi:hypothetical protein